MLQKIGRFLLAVLTLWPITYIVSIAAAALYISYRVSVAAGNPGDGLSALPRISFPGFVLGAVATAFLILFLLVYYARHAMANVSLTSQQRAMWVALLCVATPVSVVLYWYLFVGLRDSPLARTQLPSR